MVVFCDCAYESVGFIKAGNFLTIWLLQEDCTVKLEWTESIYIYQLLWHLIQQVTDCGLGCISCRCTVNFLFTVMSASYPSSCHMHNGGNKLSTHLHLILRCIRHVWYTSIIWCLYIRSSLSLSVHVLHIISHIHSYVWLPDTFLHEKGTAVWGVTLRMSSFYTWQRGISLWTAHFIAGGGTRSWQCAASTGTASKLGWAKQLFSNVRNGYGFTHVILYECETWSFTLTEDHELRVSENGTVRRMCERNPYRHGSCLCDSLDRHHIKMLHHYARHYRCRFKSRW